MTMSAPRWSARALECASAKALGLCQTSSAGGVYSPRARAWADGDVRLRGPRLPGGYRRPLRRRWRRPAPSPPPRRPRRRWRGVAGGGTSISSVVSRISLSWSALVPMVKGARFSARKCRDRQAAGWTGHPVRNAWGECGFPRGGRSSRWARHHALSARDPEQLPVGACVRDCCSTVYLRWSEIKGGHRKDRIRRTHVRRCHPRSGGEAPGAGKVPLSSARLIGCAPKAVGDAWLIPTRARRRATRLLVQRARGAARGTGRPTSRASARRPRPARSRRPSARTVQDAVDVDAEPLVVAEPRRHPARTARGDARTLMPLAARLRPGHRAAAVTVGSRSAASRWGTCHASTEADWSPIKRCRTGAGHDSVSSFCTG